MTIRRLFGVLAVLALFFTGCSSDDSESGDSSSDSSAQSDSQESGGSGSDSGSGDTSSTIDPDDLDAGEEAFDSAVPEECQFLFDLSASIGLAATGQVDSDRFSADEAPAEVRDDVETLIDAFSQFDPSDPIGSGQALASEDIQQASDNIASFVEENCAPAIDGAG
jgi:hypothetical protein